MLPRWPADPVLTDIIMPNREGPETAREIRRTRANLGIVAMSGRAQMGEMAPLDAALRLGADAAIRKPFTADELLACIAPCLSNDRSTGWWRAAE